jgi:hypothetical protein
MPAAVALLFLAAEVAFRLASFGPAAVLRPWDYSAAGFFDRGLAEPDPDPRILWRLVPSQSAMLKGARFTTNAAGFRGPEISPMKRPGETRVAVLGASISAGEGVADGECWPRRMEDRLHALGRRDVTVLNGSVQNYEASQLAAAYEARVRAFAPDAVIVPIFPALLANRDRPARGALERRDPGDLSARRLLAPFFLVKALRGALRSAAGRVLAVDWSERARPPDARDADAPTVEAVLSGFARRLEAEGTPLYLALLPKPERAPARRRARQREHAAELAARHPNVFVLDALDAVAPFVSKADRIYPGDRHPDARYHALAGRAVADALAPYLPAP